MSLPITSVKDYIITCRKNNISDSLIIDTLKKSKWPDDIIQQAINEANLIIKPIEEKSNNINQDITTKDNSISNNPLQNNLSNITNNQNNVDNSNNTNLNSTVNSNIPNDLFTQPPILQQTQQAQEQVKQKNPFSFWVIISLILSPIPIIGLGVSMSVLDYVNKNNFRGKIIVYLSFLISISVLLFILYLMLQIFTLSPEQLTGFSKTIVEKFNLL